MRKTFELITDNIFYSILVLGLIGITRNILKVYIVGQWANEWFAYWLLMKD